MELTKTKYKQTEVGLIPEDWEVRTIGEIANVKGGGTPSTRISNYWNGTINWFTPTEIGQNKYVNKSKRKITAEGLNSSSAQLLPIGTILLTSRAGIGDLAILKKESSTNQGFQSLIANEDIDYEFLYYLMLTSKNKLLEKASGSTFLEISPNNVRSIQLLIPSFTEQKAIAEVLSDVDSLIQAIEQKLAKKRAIKQGAMQKLLTPKEDWEVYKVQDIAQVGRGRVISHKEINKAKEKKYPVYSSQTANNGIMGYLDTYEFDGEYVTWTTDGENAGTVFHRTSRFNCTNVCGTIKLHKGNPKFIAFMLATLTPKHVSRNLANPKLMNDPMKKINVPFPTIDEQNRIATILSDMDKEIELIEQQLAKYQSLKQGLMQELLTGRIRLTV